MVGDEQYFKFNFFDNLRFALFIAKTGGALLPLPDYSFLMRKVGI
jgi:hypothetical protein